MPTTTVTDNEITYLRLALGSLALPTDTLQDLRRKFYANPTVISGTGAPEGVTTAAVGTKYIDTAGTLGVFEWIKQSGTGNTGWAVSVGDTGWRKVTASGSASITGSYMIRRVGSMVEIAFGDDTPTLAGDATIASGDNLGTLPVGFRPNVQRRFSYGQNGGGLLKVATITAAGVVAFLAPTVSQSLQGSFVYETRDAWPAALPGVAN